jgi:hypothetical protein
MAIGFFDVCFLSKFTLGTSISFSLAWLLENDIGPIRDGRWPLGRPANLS